MGHAVYTLSDPRAVILRENAKKMAENTEFEREYKLLEAVERLTPELFKKIKGSDKAMCANVDMYSGFVYSMLGIPEDRSLHAYVRCFKNGRLVRTQI